MAFTIKKMRNFQQECFYSRCLVSAQALGLNYVTVQILDLIYVTAHLLGLHYITKYMLDQI